MSVVIPTFRDAHCLRLTLDSLSRQTLPADLFEVLVVSDGPAGAEYDGLPERVRGLRLRFESLPEHRGRSAARNHGVRLATGDTVVFLDSDSYAAPDLLERHHRFHLSGRDRVMVGVRHEIEWPAMERLRECGVVEAPTLREVRVGMWFPDHYGAAEIERCLQTPWLFAPTQNVSLARDLIESAGLFDEGFGTHWGFEDLELFYRVYDAMGRADGGFVYDAHAVAWHLPHFRNESKNLHDWWVTESRAKERHQTFEWELGYYPPLKVAEKIRHYRAAIDACRTRKLCRIQPVWDSVAHLLRQAGSAGAVCVGFGTDEVPLPERVITSDYGRPRSERNQHLLGVHTQHPDQAFDVVVSVDFWRFLLWWDLCGFLTESLRIAGRLVLLYSKDPGLLENAAAAGLPCIDDLDYLRNALRHHFTVSVDETGGEAVLLELRPLDERREGVSA